MRRQLARRQWLDWIVPAGWLFVAVWVVGSLALQGPEPASGPRLPTDAVVVGVTEAEVQPILAWREPDRVFHPELEFRDEPGSEPHSAMSHCFLHHPPDIGATVPVVRVTAPAGSIPGWNDESRRQVCTVGSLLPPPYQGSALMWVVAWTVVAGLIAALMWPRRRPIPRWLSVGQAGTGILLFVASWWLPWALRRRYLTPTFDVDYGWPGFPILGHPLLLFALLVLAALAASRQRRPVLQGIGWVVGVLFGVPALLIYWATAALIVYSNTDTAASIGAGAPVATVAYLAVLTAAVAPVVGDLARQPEPGGG
jgi:hypothetical protein